MLQHVVDDGSHGAAGRDADFEPLGAKSFELAGDGVLEIQAIADRR